MLSFSSSQSTMCTARACVGSRVLGTVECRAVIPYGVKDYSLGTIDIAVEDLFDVVGFEPWGTFECSYDTCELMLAGSEGKHTFDSMRAQLDSIQAG